VERGEDVTTSLLYRAATVRRGKAISPGGVRSKNRRHIDEKDPFESRFSRKVTQGDYEKSAREIR